MRNAITIPFNHEEMLVVTNDNSGAIGMKEADKVHVPYEMVGYYSFRVAVMECMASGAEPISVVIQNFCGEDAWKGLVQGIKKGLTELLMEDVAITGSTESNFSLTQSAVGLQVLGKKLKIRSEEEKFYLENVALIGLPLVGEEVLSQKKDIAPLSIFRDLNNLQDVFVWPVGSKGVLSEIEKMAPMFRDKVNVSGEIDLKKSGGPSTSFLVTYSKEKENQIRTIAGTYYHKL
ncbi:ATP-binding protein [Oceanobacillus senegalensis]|uniref:ATP-binding protein n=1 Tax=Oceanobacillus senegalensis TaxID=1936063 RepID=UPI000A310E65|nr:ATP-binding protein [Oceanobacillus senegalensis]